MNTPHGIFITGTDTGVGKTLVASGLVRLAACAGWRAIGLKPVASGATATADGLRNDDALALAAAGNVPVAYELTNPYCFGPAIAPHLAAAEAGVELRLDRLADWYRRATRLAELAIIEGAGGWRVPLHPEGFLSDLPEQLGLDVLLVVGLRLGCLNHARLAHEAILQGGRCRPLGWIGVGLDPGFERPRENVAALERLLGGPPLALLPWLAAPTAAAALPHLDRPALRTALGLPG